MSIEIGSILCELRGLVLVLTLYSLRVTYRFYLKKIRVKESIKTAAEVIGTLHENILYEIAPELSKEASVMAAIP